MISGTGAPEQLEGGCGVVHVCFLNDLGSSLAPHFFAIILFLDFSFYKIIKTLKISNFDRALQ